MKGRPAKVLADADVRRVLTKIKLRRHTRRDRVIMLLSVKTGLRAGEYRFMPICAPTLVRSFVAKYCTYYQFTLSPPVAAPVPARWLPAHASHEGGSTVPCV